MINLKEHLEKCIRGWLPKEPDLPRLQRAANKSERNLKSEFPTRMPVMLSVFTVITILQFFEGSAMATLFLWFVCILGLSLTLDTLVSRGKELNEKLAATLMVAVITLGGVLANLHVFSETTSFATRAFSLSVLALVHAPLLFAGLLTFGVKRSSQRSWSAGIPRGDEKMGLKKYLKNRIRGWLPKESSQPSNKVRVTEAPTKALKIIWYVVVIAILMVIVAAVIVFYIPFLAENLVNRTIVLVIYAVGAVALYVAFGRDYYKRHQKERRVRIIVGSGLFTAFAVSVTLSLLLGPLPSYFWISFILLFAIGAFVGNLIMKKLEGHNLEATN